MYKMLHIQTKGEKIVRNVEDGCVCGIYFLATLPIIPIVLLIKGCEMCIAGTIDYFDNISKKKEHDRKMSEDWHYRLSQKARRINDLRVWKEYILDCNQHERAILQIAEADDIPLELFCHFEEYAKIYGTDEYYEKRLEILNFAYHYFTYENAKLLNISYEESHENMQKLLKRTDQVFFL